MTRTPTFIADPKLMQQVHARLRRASDSADTVCSRDLDRYYAVIAREQDQLELADWQRRLIWVACNGWGFSGADAVMLGDEMREAIDQDHAAEQAAADRDEALAFADEVETWPLPRILAAIDAVEVAGTQGEAAS